MIRSQARRAPIWAHIQRGSMPQLQVQEVGWYGYYASYAKPYLITADVQAVPVWAI